MLPAPPSKFEPPTLRSSVWRRWLALVMAWVGLFVACTPHAAADDLDDFELAREAYLAQDYDGAARRFEAMVGGPIARVRNMALRLESRKYLAVCYLFLGREAEAEVQFRRLLDEDMTYTLDRVGFPAEVISVFERVRAAHIEERREAQERAEAAEAERQRREVMRLAAEQERLRRLEEAAATETIVVRNHRALATIPFGMGQFRNGARGLGIGLAVTESLLALTAISTFIAYAQLQPTARACQDDGVLTCPFPIGPNISSPEQVRFLDRVRRLRLANIVTFSTLAATAVFGIIEAHVNYEPELRRTRPRADYVEGESGPDIAPEELIDAEDGDGAGGDEDSSDPLSATPVQGRGVDLAIGPLGGSISVRF